MYRQENTSKVPSQQSAAAFCEQIQQTLHGPHKTSDISRTDLKRFSGLKGIKQKVCRSQTIAEPKIIVFTLE